MPVLKIGHSPDADDAFMFYGFATRKVTIPGFDVEQVLEDIESLNRRSFHGELEVSAISAGVYPYVAHYYQMLNAGASVGRGYGPKILAREPLSLEELTGLSIAVPGEYTTAYLVLRLALENFEPLFLDFQEIPKAIAQGDVPAGLVIHESQLTYTQDGLSQVADLGLWWLHHTGLPLPLGLDVVRRDLPLKIRIQIREALKESIRLAYQEREQALEYALQFGRGLDRNTGQRFVEWYVNKDTLDFGSEGIRALQALFEQAYQRGLIPSVPVVDPV